MLVAAAQRQDQMVTVALAALEAGEMGLLVLATDLLELQI
jgi:hypothetical protein